MRHKTAVFLISVTLIIAALCGIFGAYANHEMASLPEGLVTSAVQPGQTAMSGIGGWFQGIFRYFGSVKALRTENEALKQENVMLDKQIRDARGLEKENQDLREMLNLMKTESKLDLVAAMVTAKDPSNWYSSFTINKGSDDGIQKNQPVLTANKELVGQVYRVGSHWAEIITVLDPESGVGSMVSRTGDLGVTEGDSALLQQGLCRLGYLSRDSEIEIGDYVETSGMGGVYPKGLLIGTILEIREDHTNMSRYATIQPVVQFSRLSEVFVLTKYVDEIKHEDFSDLEDKQENTDKKSDQSADSEDEDEERTSSVSERSENKTEKSKSTDSVGTKKTEATAKPKATAKPQSSSESRGETTRETTSAREESQERESGSEKSNLKTMNGSELSD